MSPAGQLYQTRFTKVALGPMHTVSEGRLPTRREKLRFLLSRKAERYNKAFHSIADTDFTLSSHFEDRQHEGLEVRNGQIDQSQQTADDGQFLPHSRFQI